LRSNIGAFDIEIDPGAGKLYWTTETKIQRANLDCTGITDLVTLDYQGPCSADSLYLYLPHLINADPVADAGPDQTVDCLGAVTPVTLDGTASYDSDGDELTFEWSVPEGSGAEIDDIYSPTPTGFFPLGPTAVTLTVTDGKGGVAVDDVLIEVVDLLPPVLIATTDTIALWPPKHQMQDVWIRVAVTDCAWDTDVILTALVASSEPDDATGDGSFVGDVDGQDGYTFPVPVTLIYTHEPEPGVYVYEGLVSLRAERDGSESSRVYSVVCDVEDLAGNISTASCAVVVPHDRRK
jgi:hypothetical protein